MTATERRQATAAAGWRERYAMEHGTPKAQYIRGEKCYIFTYSTAAEYQDANGATYNAYRRQWIN